MDTLEPVYLLMDVDVGGVRRPPCGIPTQKLQLLEHLFNWRRGQSKQYFFKSLFLSFVDLMYFFRIGLE